MRYPRMLRVRQQVQAARPIDVEATVRHELARLRVGDRIRPGQSVAITCGSRGIANIAVIIRAIVGVLRAGGAKPFLVPAMGSHGGATAEGQRQVIESYGITEAFTGAPIRSSLDVVEVGITEDGVPVYIDRLAHEADHIAVVNRIKPHTRFSGRIESGLMKMLMVGLGNRAGASVCHRAAVEHSFDHLVRTIGHTLLARCRVAFGLGIVENCYEETALVEAVGPEELEERERVLLALARGWMPRLPIGDADLLIVDEMGKDISGVGMDSNVTGRRPGGRDRHPKIRRLFVRELSPGSHGNAHGIGLADFTTNRLVRAMDYEATMLNAITAVEHDAAVLPLHFETDREAIDAALSTIGLVPAEQARVVRIRNTLQLTEVDVSEAYRPELARRPDLEVLDPPHDLVFDGAGNLRALGA